jgi:hypothetical protein
MRLLATALRYCVNGGHDPVDEPAISGSSLVSSIMRVPLLAARITTFISATVEHGWIRIENKILGLLRATDF